MPQRPRAPQHERRPTITVQSPARPQTQTGQPAELEGAAVVGGASALGAALVSIGIPNDSIIQYEAQIKAGKYVVIAHDSPGHLEKAKAALEATQHQGMELHSSRA